MKNIKIIKDNEKLKELLNDNTIHGDIDLRYVDISITEINKLVHRTENLKLLRCNVKIDNSLQLGPCYLIISDSKFIASESKLMVVNSIRFIYPLINLLRCESNIPIELKFHCVNLYKLIICDSPFITGLNIAGSNITDIILIECENLKSTTITHSDINFLNSEFNKQDLYFDYATIPTLNLDKYNNIISVENSYNSLSGGLLGSELKFDIFGYKKVLDSKLEKNIILYLKIPKGSKIYCDNNTGKCRTDKVITMSAMDMDGNVINDSDETIKYHSVIYNNPDIYYQLNKVTKPDSYDSALQECTNGIHFFLDLDKALEF